MDCTEKGVHLLSNFQTQNLRKIVDFGCRQIFFFDQFIFTCSTYVKHFIQAINLSALSFSCPMAPQNMECDIYAICSRRQFRGKIFVLLLFSSHLERTLGKRNMIIVTHAHSSYTGAKKTYFFIELSTLLRSSVECIVHSQL